MLIKPLGSLERSLKSKGFGDMTQKTDITRKEQREKRGKKNQIGFDRYALSNCSKRSFFILPSRQKLLRQPARPASPGEAGEAGQPLAEILPEKP